MSFALIIEVLMALLKFPKELSAFIKLISKTPEEKRVEILERIAAEEKHFEDTGRPQS